MDWITAILTVVSMQMIVRKKRSGFWVGIASQVAWVFTIMESKQWGLFVSWAAITITYVQGLKSWRKPDV